MQDELPPIPLWRAEEAQRIYQEVQTMNMPLEITQEIIQFLEGTGFTAFVLFLLYRLVNSALKNLPEAARKYAAWKR